MAGLQADSVGTGADSVKQYDAIVVGAGVSGLYQLHCLKQLGLDVRLFEDGDGVGGTWYWNRYPGCRFDSESETYGYSFSKELLQEWDWKEHFSAQPDTERYLNFVADKFKLRDNIQLSSRVTSAVFDEKTSTWDVTVNNKEKVRAQFLIAAVGILSARFTPDFPGIDSFTGRSLHTGTWPKESVDLKGKRVAVIGTGPTAVQLITEIAKEVGHLTVFQRTPNYCAPLRNGLVSPETQSKWKKSYDNIHEQIHASSFGFRHEFDSRAVFEVNREERLARYEELWQQAGFAKWLSNFHDIGSDPKANEDFAEFVRDKIRARVKDPLIAEKLVPKDHPFGAKRIPLESGYYEVYNQPNVELVSVRETPIERITAKGIKTSDQEREFDIIIYATGFDAITGPLTRIDIRGEKGKTIKEAWADGPRTNLGIQTAGFPNLFIAASSAFCNYPVCAEMVVEWIRDSIAYMRSKGYKRIVPTPEAEEAWIDHAAELASHTLLTSTKSWFMGTNIPGKKPVLLLYANSAPNYRKECADVAASGYRGFELQ
jgi:cation diffusion facilitator CzcD-associated flavoprotein CzcO